MTNLEHLIENTLIHFEKGYEAEDILTEICKDPNLKGVRIPTDQIYEICQYVWCTYLDNGHRLVDGKDMTNGEKLVKEYPKFVAHCLAKVCDIVDQCEFCPLYETGNCGNKKEIEKWLEQGVEEDAKVY